MFYRVKNCMVTALSLALCLAFSVFLYAKDSVFLTKTQGARTFYLDSASSQGLIKTELSLADLPRVRGESVVFSCESDGEQMALGIFEEYDGSVAFVETVGGVTSYYGYAEGLGAPILLYGRKINLHVAVEDSRFVVGTPIIFGGF